MYRFVRTTLSWKIEANKRPKFKSKKNPQYHIKVDSAKIANSTKEIVCYTYVIILFKRPDCRISTKTSYNIPKVTAVTLEIRKVNRLYCWVNCNGSSFVFHILRTCKRHVDRNGYVGELRSISFVMSYLSICKFELNPPWASECGESACFGYKFEFFTNKQCTSTFSPFMTLLKETSIFCVSRPNT